MRITFAVRRVPLMRSDFVGVDIPTGDKRSPEERKEQDKNMERQWFAFMDRSVFAAPFGLAAHPVVPRTLWCPEILQSLQLRGMVVAGIPHCLRGARHPGRRPRN